MFKSLSIRIKILMAFLVIAIVSVGVIAFFSFTVGSRSLEEESFNKLTAIREMKANQVEDYFQLIEDQVVTLSEDRMIIDAMRAFDGGLHGIEDELNVSAVDLEEIDADLKAYYAEEFVPRLETNLDADVSPEDFWPADEKSRILQNYYISNNPFEVGTKHLLDNADEGSTYSQAHEEFHPIIRDFQEKFGYYDIFLVDVDTGGHIAYSVFKEVDFGTSLLDGPYADTNIGRAYQAALKAEDKNDAFLVDYDPYAPSYNAPASFISSPIFDGEELIGVLIFQMPIDRIDAIMTNDQDWSAVGLGESGETYLVGDDFTLRNQSRFLIEDSDNYFKLIEEIGVPAATVNLIRNLNTTIGMQEVTTEGTQAALSGETGTAIFPDYRGVPVLSSYKPLDIEGLNWAIMSEMDESEAFSSIRSLGINLALGSLGLIAFILLAATLFSRTITRPIADLQSQASEISAGNLDTRITVDIEDEISDLADALEIMRVSNKDLIDDLANINQNLENLVADRTAALEASERQSTSIIELSSDAIIVIDEQGKVLVWNAMAEELFGYSQEDIVGNPMDVIIPDIYKADHARAFARASETRSLKAPGVTHELSGRHRDGKEFPVELSLSHWEISGKSYFSASIRDITERKRMEAEIADQLAFVRTLIDTVPNPIFAVGPDQRYILFNKAYEEAYGMEAKDQLGKTVMDIETLSLEEREFYRDQNLELLATGGMNHDELEIRFADGELHTILQWVTAFRQGDGTIGGLVGITADISELKELERQLEIANERMSTELNFARDIQISMLPLIFPAFPDRKEVTIHAALDSAREVGGDFYDFYFLDDDYLCFVVGDVSGKGAPGALMMAVSKTLIKSRAADDNEPASILTHVNDELAQDNVSSMFVTVFLGILNVKTGEFTYTNAGHNPPYIKRKDGSIQKIDAFHGPVIGAMPGMPYDQDSDTLYEGDVILVYSDGVTEAFDEEEQLFSEERLEALLQKEGVDSDKSVVKETQKALAEFVGEAEQSDDVTLLALQYLMRPEAKDSQELHITIKNQYDDMALVEAQFAKFADENDLPDPIRQAMSIVVDELLNNVISYAYQGEKEKDIEVNFELSGNRLVLTIKDAGVPFNPFARETPDVSETLEEREVGGLGIHMVRNLMDEYSYQRQINKNVVTLVKLIEEDE